MSCHVRDQGNLLGAVEQSDSESMSVAPARSTRGAAVTTLTSQLLDSLGVGFERGRFSRELKSSAGEKPSGTAMSTARKS